MLKTKKKNNDRLIPPWDRIKRNEEKEETI